MTGESSKVQETALFSYGFRPFFLSAAVFAGVAIPVWVLVAAGTDHWSFFSAPPEWHVHEMLFGFLSAVIAGFVLTAMPNWTDRPPIQGMPLMLLWIVWLAGRLTMAFPWPPLLISAIVDSAFLIVLSYIVWREIAIGRTLDRLPIELLISIYAMANIVFHVQNLKGAGTDLPERMALAVIILLLALIGGRVTPGFTLDFLSERGMNEEPSPFSRFDGVAILLAGLAALIWTIQPQAPATGWLLLAAGLANLIRLLRWHGWVTWREPLVLILHMGYGWLAVSLFMLGTAVLELGMHPADAVHALTTGAVGSMTLAIMTRASLGHTGRPRHAEPATVLIYALINIGAILRVFGPAAGVSDPLMLGLSGIAWSGAYVLFALVYGRYLLRPSLNGE
jgi:uncharacterized protein involved in response to NO